jgi:hypothetical protein
MKRKRKRKCLPPLAESSNSASTNALSARVSEQRQRSYAHAAGAVLGLCPHTWRLRFNENFHGSESLRALAAVLPLAGLELSTHLHSYILFFMYTFDLTVILLLFTSRY